MCCFVTGKAHYKTCNPQKRGPPTTETADIRDWFKQPRTSGAANNSAGGVDRGCRQGASTNRDDGSVNPSSPSSPILVSDDDEGVH